MDEPCFLSQGEPRLFYFHNLESLKKSESYALQRQGDDLLEEIYGWDKLEVTHW